MKTGLLGTDAGCKVGWEYYRTRKDAEAQVESAREFAALKERQGYDFGYQVPGSIDAVPDHKEYGECWRLTVA